MGQSANLEKLVALVPLDPLDQLETLALLGHQGLVEVQVCTSYYLVNITVSAAMFTRFYSAMVYNAACYRYRWQIQNFS